MTKECTKCGGEFTWKMPYDGTKVPSGSNPCKCAPKKAAAPKKEKSEDSQLNFSTDEFGSFEVLANKAYQRLSILAASFCEEGATARDKHICTCGLLHDYFTWKVNQ